MPRECLHHPNPPDLRRRQFARNSGPRRTLRPCRPRRISLPYALVSNEAGWHAYVFVSMPSRILYEPPAILPRRQTPQIPPSEPPHVETPVVIPSGDPPDPRPDWLRSPNPVSAPFVRSHVQQTTYARIGWLRFTRRFSPRPPR